MNNRIKEILLNRKSVIIWDSNSNLGNTEKISFAAQFLSLWYNVKWINLLSNDIIDNSNVYYSILNNKRGWHVKHVPLFSNFPNIEINDNELLIKRVLWFISNSLFTLEWKTMDNWLIIPDFLFDINDFWADPITWYQDSYLYQEWLKKEELKESDNVYNVIDINIVSEDEWYRILFDYINSLLEAKSSIPEFLYQDINYVLRNSNYVEYVDFEKITFKENKTFILNTLYNMWFLDKLSQWFKTPTDILRFLASLTESDISLREKIRFPRLKRSDRKLILKTLDRMLLNNGNVVEDNLENLWKYRWLWNTIFKYIHTNEYFSKYPDLISLINYIRNEKNKITTINSLYEWYVLKWDIDSILNMLKNKPWLLLRKYHDILTKSNNDKYEIIKKIENILLQNVDKVELKMLLVIKNFFNEINTSEKRTVINKFGKVKVLSNNKLHMLSQSTVNDVINSLHNVIIEKISSKITEEQVNLFSSNDFVYLTEQLNDKLIPLNLRTSSEWLFSYGRWTKFSLDNKKTIRLFLYWKQKNRTTDYDLSVILLNKDLRKIWHVSYTNLSSKWLKHSGDITSAQNWATEYIDIDVKNLSDNVKYIVPYVYNYWWEGFKELDEAFVWFMLRENTSTAKQFDPKTVIDKINIDNDWSSYTPFMFDVENSELIFVDIYRRLDNMWNNVEWDKNVEFLSEIMNFHKSKLWLKELLMYYFFVANKMLWKNTNIYTCEEDVYNNMTKKDEEKLLIVDDTFKYNLKEPEKILSELL